MKDISTFKDLDINDELIQVLDEIGFSTPTQIQQAAIPLLLKSKKNFVGQAQTGTGKTAAFVIPLLSKINYSKNHIQSLILTPTRELANQVESEIKSLGRYTQVKTICLYGGVEYEPQVLQLNKIKPHVVVGTPGRIIDLIKKRKLRLEQTSLCILDEADEMLNMGFFEDVEFIIERLKTKTQLMMFSATMPRPIVKMISSSFGEHDFVKVKTERLSNDNIEQKYFVVREKHFKEALSRLIDDAIDMYGIVFCRTKIETREVGDDLKKRGLNVEVLNGDMGQPERDLAMNNFKKKKAKILVCTDVAARGIDIQGITHVFNYGLPRDNESYVHRIGRTGRASMKGKAYSIVGPKTKFAIEAIEAHTKQKMTKSSLPSIEVLKENIVRAEIDNAKLILNAIKAKGSDFKTEDSYKFFEQAFKGLSSEELMKLMFVWKFNKDMRRYNNLADIESFTKSIGKSKKDRPKPGRSKKKGPKKFSHNR